MYAKKGETKEVIEKSIDYSSLEEFSFEIAPSEPKKTDYFIGNYTEDREVEFNKEEFDKTGIIKEGETYSLGAAWIYLDEAWVGVTVTNEAEFTHTCIYRGKIKTTKSYVTEDDEIIESTASQLQPQIATWYKTLRLIAIVGLLSILVYVGIRMMISSTGKDKAKYKKMFTDWLVAMCILFTLHYIMVFTMTITETITDIFVSDDGISLVNNDQSDKLLSEVRTEASDFKQPTYMFSKNFTWILVYLVLVVITFVFVFQYFKRLLWLAFLTMIAPLIALTYPLDKIKDGQAQAFGLWVKEYVFNALLPIMHIVLYYMLVDSAMDFIIKGDNWLYAIVMIGFMIPGEKFLKKMFGFNNSESVSNFEAAAGGALVMNMMNKLEGAASGGGAPGGTGGGAPSNGPSGIRTAERDPLGGLQNGAGNSGADPAIAIRTNGNQPDVEQGEPQNANSEIASQQQRGQVPSQSSASGAGEIGSVPGRSLGTNSPRASQQGNNSTLRQRMGERYNRLPPAIRGVAHLARQQTFTRKAAQRNLRALAKIGGAAAGLTIGLAAGIATGDFSKTATYASAGLLGGSKIGARGVDGAFGAWDSARTGIDNIRDGYNEGAYGTEEASNRRFDREFKRSEEYKTIIRSYPRREREIERILASGITDTKRITTILKSMEKSPRVSIDHAIAYNTLANQCSDSVLYDNSKFIKFLRLQDIPVDDYSDQEIEALKQSMIDFK